MSLGRFIVSQLKAANAAFNASPAARASIVSSSSSARPFVVANNGDSPSSSSSSGCECGSSGSNTCA
ncbi:uncharacterized protein SAPINGB_P004327 [Magnusiomyces paraingens]|uniref:Uncharacterized protein n=1 Tax=Magnusiomyces paraingens TaxID=2606893 RepID=A0A5E8BZA1_9ASCO|nr:uncharacterized protein SAPINGB_P004327 [Saprochaete ingens]VVT54917.1 unnamed protein product [Saprochaete ingens]